MSLELVELKWYCISQNNTGGKFTVNDLVAHWVYVQAPSEEYAKLKFEEITELSSSSSKNADYCPCCGERWGGLCFLEDGTDEPMAYDWETKAMAPIAQVIPILNWNEEARLHYLDGRIEKFKFLQRVK